MYINTKNIPKSVKLSECSNETFLVIFNYIERFLDDKDNILGSKYKYK